MRNHYTP
jgi:hypothetical protein